MQKFKTFAQIRKEGIAKTLMDIKYCMEDLKLGRTELARRIDLPYTTVHRLLSGKTKMTIGHLALLCYGIGVELDVKITIPPDVRIRRYR